MELQEFLLRVGSALIAGLFIGAEGEYRQKDAGVKTNALVSLGATVFVVISLSFEGEEFFRQHQDNRPGGERNWIPGDRGNPSQENYRKRLTTAATIM